MYFIHQMIINWLTKRLWNKNISFKGFLVNMGYLNLLIIQLLRLMIYSSKKSGMNERLLQHEIKTLLYYTSPLMMGYKNNTKYRLQK